MVLAAGWLQGCAVMPEVKKDAEASEVVLLLPGLGRSSRSMQKLEKRLGAAGYRVEALDYPSTVKTIEELSEHHLGPAVERSRAAGGTRIHFVAHSMGGIMLRYYLAGNPLPERGRIVMLGPPNRGSEVVDKLGGIPFFEWINGPAGLQLGTSSDSLPNTLPDPGGEVAVIAGTNSINWILSTMIPGADDGKVSVDRTRLSNMADFAAVPVSHPFLMSDRDVIEMVVSFLETGSFESE